MVLRSSVCTLLICTVVCVKYTWDVVLLTDPQWNLERFIPFTVHQYTLLDYRVFEH